MRELRLVLLGLAAVIALLLGAAFLVRAFTPQEKRVASHAPPTIEPRVASPGLGNLDKTTPLQTAPAPPGARAAIERAIADAPAYARFFDRMRLLFPSDYDAVMNGLADTSGTSADIDVDKLTAAADAALRRKHGKLQAQASDAALAQVFSADLQAMQALSQRDAHLCVSYLFNASGSGFLGFAADHRDLVAAIAIAGLDAMNSGRMDADQRASPTDSDLQSFDQALVAHGLSRPEIEVLLDGKAANPPIADATMCKAGVTYLETLASLPPAMRSRFYGLAVGLRS